MLNEFKRALGQRFGALEFAEQELVGLGGEGDSQQGTDDQQVFFS